MIILTSTDKIRLNTTTTSAIHVHASWMDNVAGAIGPGRTNTPAIVTGTTTDIVPSPAAGVFRNVKTLNIHNAGNAMNPVGVTHFDGSTTVVLHNVNLAPEIGR